MLTIIGLVILLLVPLILALPRLVTAWYSKRLIHGIEASPARRVAIVFGAGLWWDGSPSAVLRDRVATAAELYHAGKAQKLLLSGSNPIAAYNEPAAMRDYALLLGVPDEDIILDYAGRRTYDTCYRAKAIFKVPEAILVTQSFHLPRALYVCNRLGLSAIGIASDRRQYRRAAWIYWNLREMPATLVALWEVHITRPLPILGNPEPIFPLEAQ